MQATGELGDLGFSLKKAVKKVAKTVRKVVPKPILKIAKKIAPLTPAVFVSKSARKDLRKMVPKPIKAIAKRLAPVVMPASLLFKSQRKTASKALKSISPKARKVAAIAAGAVAATGVAVALSQSERSEAVSALVDQGMSPGSAEQAVNQASGGGGGGSEPAPGAEEATQAGMGGSLPILLIGGAIAFGAYTFMQKGK